MAAADSEAQELEGDSEALRGDEDDGIVEPRPSIRKKTKRVRPREPGEATLTSPPNALLRYGAEAIMNKAFFESKKNFPTKRYPN